VTQRERNMNPRMSRARLHANNAFHSVEWLRFCRDEGIDPDEDGAAKRVWDAAALATMVRAARIAEESCEEPAGIVRILKEEAERV
jgi:hypothetical protein